MCKISDQLINECWEKATIAEGYDPQKIRLDACGAWIRRDKYNQQESIFGWDIDHIYPKKILKLKGVPDEAIDNIENLRPLNWMNNLSKGEDYPYYLSAIIANGNKNKREVNSFEIDGVTQSKLSELFSEYL